MPDEFDFYEKLTAEEKREFLRYMQEIADEENAWLQNTVDPVHEEWLAEEVINKN